MAQRSSFRSRRARVLLAIVGVVAVAAVLGGGLLVGTGGLGFLIEPTPEILYVTYPPGPTATPGASESADSTASASASATASATASTDPSPTGSPSAPPTATLTYGPPGPTPALANLKFNAVGGVTAFYCGRPGTVGVVVINDGPVATTGTANLYLTETHGGHDDFSTYKTIPILAPGATHAVSFTIVITAGCGSEHVTTFRIDPSNSLPESTKLDNVYSWPHYVEAAGPNLRVTDFTLDPREPECSVGFDVVIRVSNLGSLTAPASNLRVVDMVGTTELIRAKVVRVPTLAAFSSAYVTVHLTVMSHCVHEYHTIKATADYDGLIDETYEDDNTGYGGYYMGGA